MLVAHPWLKAGGSEARALHLLDSLQNDFRVTLVTLAPVEWDRLNRAYGTQVDPAAVEVAQAPMPALLRRIAVGDALRGAFLQRLCRRLGPRFDVRISAYNFVDFGAPALQFVADFSWRQDFRVAHDHTSGELRGLATHAGPLWRAYRLLVERVAGGRGDALPPDAADTVIANSQWTAGLLKDLGIDARVIYPPVQALLPLAEEGPRSSDFVILGRVSPEKRIETAIEIVHGVRARGHDVRLHVVGALDGSEYARRIRKLGERSGPWVVLHGAVYGPAKAELLAAHGFGLHARQGEAFGIAVAEMVKLGLIPFVHSFGAPAEIVAEPRLVYDDVDTAVEQIDTVLRDLALQERLRQHLAQRADLFSAKRFVAEVRQLLQAGL